MVWINACWQCFEWINFVSKHTANFRWCIKLWLQLPVESVISCLRRVYHAFCGIDDDFGGNCRHDCAVTVMLLLASKKMMEWGKSWVMNSEGLESCWQNLTAERITFWLFVFSHDLLFKLPHQKYCTFGLNWQPLNWGSFVLGFCQCNCLHFWLYPTVHWVNCGIGSKTESIVWVEAKNEAPPNRRWGNERVVVIFTYGF